MTCYSNERKAALLKKLLPPINMSVAELARQEHIRRNEERNEDTHRTKRRVTTKGPTDRHNRRTVLALVLIHRAELISTGV